MESLQIPIQFIWEALGYFTFFFVPAFLYQAGITAFYMIQIMIGREPRVSDLGFISTLTKFNNRFSLSTTITGYTGTYLGLIPALMELYIFAQQSSPGAFLSMLEHMQYALYTTVAGILIGSLWGNTINDGFLSSILDKLEKKEKEEKDIQEARKGINRTPEKRRIAGGHSCNGKICGTSNWRVPESQKYREVSNG